MDKTSLGDRMKQYEAVSKKKVKFKDGSSTLVDRPQWVIDLNIPVFTQDRDYVNSLLTFDKERKNDD